MVTFNSLDTILSASSQLILSMSEDWVYTDVKMMLLERDRVLGKWNIEGKPFSAVCGRNGMAWDPSLAISKVLDSETALKKEGDMQAPAGVFPLGKAFGYRKAEEVTFEWPYIAITPTLQAIDDPNSVWYNQIVDTYGMPRKDWNSSETMLRPDGLYGWGLVINYNTAPIVPGRGSCIFMHLWRGPGQGTEGCTAMSEENILRLLNWLKPDAHPMLLQIPRPILERWAKEDRLAAQLLEIVQKA